MDLFKLEEILDFANRSSKNSGDDRVELSPEHFIDMINTLDGDGVTLRLNERDCSRGYEHCAIFDGYTYMTVTKEKITDL